MRPEEVLGVAPGADLREVRAAFRALVRVHHPDAHVHDPPAAREWHARRLRAAVAAWQEISSRSGERWDPVDPRLAPDAEASGADSLGEDDLLGGVVPGRALGTRARLVVLVPALLLACSVATFAVSVVLATSSLWVASVAMFVGALGGFALVPFFVMLRTHR